MVLRCDIDVLAMIIPPVMPLFGNGGRWIRLRP
jgi:hypothetical protein